LNSDGNVGTWIFHGSSGKGTWPKNGAKSTLTIEQYDSGKILIRRENTPDSSAPDFTAIYEGTLHGRRVDGTVTATAGHPPRTFKYPWYATVPVTSCGSDGSTDAQDASETGQTALRFRQAPSALQCFLIAAKGGDGQAKALVGLMYRDGIGTASNIPEAFHWLQAGAIQDDYNAEVGLSQMYEAGIGTGADPEKARMWRERAQNNPVMIRQREQAHRQAEQQQAAEKMMFLGLAAAVEAMSQPDVYVVY
jgi:TPR repeat protein